MKKNEILNYVSPMVEVVAVEVEKGFAASPTTGDSMLNGEKDPAGDLDWD